MAELTYLHTIAPCIAAVWTISMGAPFLFTAATAIAVTKDVLTHIKHQGPRERWDSIMKEQPRHCQAPSRRGLITFFES